MEKSIGVYLFSRPGQSGTLEDILLPMFELSKPEFIDKGQKFIDDCFTWQVEQDSEQQKITNIAKRKKSIITVIGQKMKPGGSMNVIVDQGKLISQDIFRNNEDVKRFANFVASIAEFLL